MKRTIALMFMIFVLLFAACTAPHDRVIDLGEETESVLIEENVDGLLVIINKDSGVYHLQESCRYLERMKEENRLVLSVKNREVLLDHGYKTCKGCAVQKGPQA